MLLLIVIGFLGLLLWLLFFFAQMRLFKIGKEITKTNEILNGVRSDLAKLTKWMEFLSKKSNQEAE